MLKLLERDQKLLEKYKTIIQTYTDKGCTRTVNANEIALTSQITWYLPHNPVFNPMKPNKLRVVFDAAATCEKRGLNTLLRTSPDLLNSSIVIRLRFRNNEIALVADIEVVSLRYVSLS